MPVGLWSMEGIRYELGLIAQRRRERERGVKGIDRLAAGG